MTTNMTNESFGNELTTKLLSSLNDVINTILPDENEEKITFIDNNIPVLKSGMYTIKVHQEIEISGRQMEQTGTAKKHIHIGGLRYSVSTDIIQAVFPPASSSADYTATFPHITFNRSSIPWEIQSGTNKQTPWLALILFYEDETPEMQEVQLESLRNQIGLPSFQNGKQLVQVIKVPDHLLPRNPEWCSHVRQTTDKKSKKQNETAWIISDRLPKAGMKNTAHLVSLADKLENNRFISLYHWQFDCQEGHPSFTGLIKDITAAPYCYYSASNNNFNRHFKEGYIPLPHFLRLGYRTLSLYQSPLLPYTPPVMRRALRAVSPPKPKYSYERVEWVKLDDGSKMADVSFAAAFHLGQMLTVANKQVAQTIFKWKRQFYQSEKKAYLERNTQKNAPDLLNEQNTTNLPDLVVDWVTDFLTLKKIPFNYLVPHEAMLPENSIRFFKLHKKWLKNCLDGVFSIGEEYFNFNAESVLYTGDYSGFIMRNPIISHYPEVEIKGYYQKTQQIELLFIRKLSPEIIICCFKGLINRVELSLPSSVMYFGLGKENLNQKDKNGLVNFSSVAESLNCKNPSDLAVQLIRNSPKAMISY